MVVSNADLSAYIATTGLRVSSASRTRRRFKWNSDFLLGLQDDEVTAFVNDVVSKTTDVTVPAEWCWPGVKINSEKIPSLYAKLDNFNPDGSVIRADRPAAQDAKWDKAKRSWREEYRYQGGTRRLLKFAAQFCETWNGRYGTASGQTDLFS